MLFHASSYSQAQTLVIQDDFNGDKLNSFYWNTKQEFGPHINADSDKQIFLANNVVVEEGKLKLFLKEEPNCYDTWRFCDSSYCIPECANQFRDNKCQNPTKCELQGKNCLCLVPKYYKYTGGMLVSKEKFSFGVFEIKCKIPKDCMPAFWLYGDCCSEIDIFEFLGCEEDNASITIHQCPKKNCNNNLQCGKNFNQLKNAIRHDFSNDFHIWKLDWKMDGMTIYVDDNEIFSCKSNGLGACLYNTFNTSGGSCTIGTNTLYPDGSMNLIVNLATNPNDCIPPTPSVLEIEHIKVWQYPK